MPGFATMVSPSPRVAITSANRLAYIDVAKGLGITLVVLGHALLDAQRVCAVIFAFHMPLFFFLSGLLHKPLEQVGAYRSFLKKHLIIRLVPYCTFALIYFIVTIALRIASRRIVEPDVIAAGLQSIAFGEPTRGTELWFFPCLLITECIGAMVARLRNRGLALVWVILLAGIGLYVARWNTFLPWSLDVALVALPFWFAGTRGKQWILQQLPSKPAFHFGVALVAMAFLTDWHLFHLGNNVDMRTSTYGFPPLFYANAFAGIMLAMVVAHLLRHSRTFTEIGRAAFLIFPTHGLFFMLLILGFHFWAGLPLDSKDHSIGMEIAYSCLAIIAGTVLLPALGRSSVAEFLFSGRTKAKIVLPAQSSGRSPAGAIFTSFGSKRASTSTKSS